MIPRKTEEINVGKQNEIQGKMWKTVGKFLGLIIDNSWIKARKTRNNSLIFFVGIFLDSWLIGLIQLLIYKFKKIYQNQRCWVSIKEIHVHIAKASDGCQCGCARSLHQIRCVLATLQNLHVSYQARKVWVWSHSRAHHWQGRFYYWGEWCAG